MDPAGGSQWGDLEEDGGCGVQVCVNADGVDVRVQCRCGAGVWNSRLGCGVQCSGLGCRVQGWGMGLKTGV